MNRRKGIASLIATLMIVSMVMVLPLPVTAADPPTITVTFPNTTNSSLNEYDVGATFRVDITIDSNGVAIWTWQVGIYFNPDILECTGLGEGDFFVGYTSTGLEPYTINNTEGYVTYTANSLKAPEVMGVVGTGTLLWYEFRVKGYSSGILDLTPYWEPNPEGVPKDLLCGSGLWWSTGEPPALVTDTVLIDGSFDNTGLKPLPYPPKIVEFSYSPSFVHENDNVTFTAVTEPGFDGDNFISVSEYRWDLDGNGVFELNTTVATAVHNYTTAGTYYPALEVYAGPNPGNETASTSTELTVFAVVESYIDLQTVKSWKGRETEYRERGDGPGFPGSAFAPGETVTLVTDVVFLGLPVIDLNVGFRATDKDGVLLSSQSGITDIAGRAEVDFRLRQAPLPPFGAYEVNCTARMFEEDFSDTLKFYVGWIIKITGVTADPSTVARPAYGEYTPIAFTVTVTNYDPYDSYMAFITVSAFDSLNQILNTTDIDIVIPSAGTPEPGTAGPSKTTSYILTTGIPYAAWPGVASMKANAYTKDPGAGGTAYCPEVESSFTIT